MSSVRYCQLNYLIIGRRHAPVRSLPSPKAPNRQRRRPPALNVNVAAALTKVPNHQRPRPATATGKATVAEETKWFMAVRNGGCADSMKTFTLTSQCRGR